MTEQLPVAVDVMGGDNAPDALIEGALLAVDRHDLSVLLVGDPELIADRVGSRTENVSIKPASEVIEMHAEPASSVRKLRDSSVVRTMEAVRDGQACAALSAGNTGAAMASSLLRLGRIKGVSRPAIAGPFPVLGSTPTTMLDLGANADCQPEWLRQFAILGSVYATTRFKIERPRVGVLTIGEEAGKGNTLVKDTVELLSEPGWAESVGAEYIGNVEASELMVGVADVVVCDGFTGNVVLKALEGFNVGYEAAMRAELGKDDVAMRSASPLLKPLWDTYNSGNIGSAMLLGTRGVTMISHGSASAENISNAVKTAKQLDSEGVVLNLRQAIGANR